MGNSKFIQFFPAKSSHCPTIRNVISRRAKIREDDIKHNESTPPVSLARAGRGGLRRAYADYFPLLCHNNSIHLVQFAGGIRGVGVASGGKIPHRIISHKNRHVIGILFRIENRFFAG